MTPSTNLPRLPRKHPLTKGLTCLLASTALAATLTACTEKPAETTKAAAPAQTSTSPGSSKASAAPATATPSTPATTTLAADTGATERATAASTTQAPKASPNTSPTERANLEASKPTRPPAGKDGLPLTTDVKPKRVPAELDAVQQNQPARDANQIQRPVGPLEFEPSPLDLGEMNAGIAKTGTVRLINTSDTAITITKAIPGCGCTTLGWPKDPIPPGEAADVEITLKPGPKQGIRLKKRVTFQIEGHPSQILSVEGEVAAYVTIAPDIIAARDEDAEQSEEIVLTSADGTPFAVLSVEPPVVLDADNETGLEHTMHVDWAAWEEAGRPVKVAFKTDHPKASQVTALVKRRPNTPRNPNDLAAAKPRTPSINDLSGAARAGDSTRVKLLLADGKDPNQADPNGGRTPLHWAVRSGNEEIVAVLIEAGADVNKGDQAGKTPLSHAAESGKVELTRKLIAAGADVNKRDLVGGNSVLWAAGLGTPETLEIVVKAGGNVDVKDINGLTPLQWAAQTGKTQSMNILIAGGADVNATDNLNGESVLMRAARSGRVESITLLLENGADTNSRTKLGANVLHIGSEFGNASVVKALVESGLDPNAVDQRNPGWNALDYANNRVDDGRFQIIAYLTPLVATEEAPAPETPKPGAEE